MSVLINSYNMGTRDLPDTQLATYAYTAGCKKVNVCIHNYSRNKLIYSNI